MGLYSINCPSCSKAHIWFSGSMDQRCEECKKPKEFWIKKNEYEGAVEYERFYPVVSETEFKTGIHVIEKSAFDFQCKQTEDMAKQFNETCQYYMKLVNDLNTQIEIERAEVARLLAVTKRTRVRREKKD